MSGVCGTHDTLPSYSDLFAVTHIHNTKVDPALKQTFREMCKEMERKVGGEMEGARGLAAVPAPPASLDPSHLPQLLPGFNCHSN